MRGLDTTYPHITTLPQYKVEQTLQGRLSKKVERPVKLLSYVQESDHVVAKLQHGDDKNNVEEVKAKFLIGSDGVHSAVRKGTPGWTFDGLVFNLPLALADVTLTGENLPDPRYFNFMDSNSGAMIIMSLPDKNGEKIISRVVVSLGTLNASNEKEDSITQGIHKEDPFTLKELQDEIDKRCGRFQIKAENPQWLAKFGINEREANGYRRNRAFVIGGKGYFISVVENLSLIRI
jgi:2-polyprenyl-6-methoxyphenol hydroxylase-like FAD-dependent oxidoreductase